MTGIKVLIVEDNPLALEINREFLKEDADFAYVGAASSGQEALDFIMGSPPDLVLLDNFLPDFNGLVLIEKVRQFNSKVDFIMVTAAKEVPIVQKSFHLGIRDYLIKPYLKERLLQALHDYKRFYTKLNQDHSYDQEGVDAVAKAAGRFGSVQPSKGISSFTKEKILAVFERFQDGVTAEEVAGEIGISLVAARNYLRTLVQERVVSMDLNYGSLGRPSHVFYLAASEGKKSKRD